jgi:hypothetical protein
MQTQPKKKRKRIVRAIKPKLVYTTEKVKIKEK